MRVGDVIAEAGAFATDIAYCCHRRTPLKIERLLTALNGGKGSAYPTPKANPNGAKADPRRKGGNTHVAKRGRGSVSISMA
ncbi:MAG TPA: hypothetical protein VF307_04050 [Candidatus Nanopelagicaceae bacterium]